MSLMTPEFQNDYRMMTLFVCQDIYITDIVEVQESFIFKYAIGTAHVYNHTVQFLHWCQTDSLSNNSECPFFYVSGLFHNFLSYSRSDGIDIMKAEYSSTAGGVTLSAGKTRSGCSNKRWIIGIITTLLLLGIIAVIVYFAAFHKQVIFL